MHTKELLLSLIVWSLILVRDTPLQVLSYTQPTNCRGSFASLASILLVCVYNLCHAPQLTGTNWWAATAHLHCTIRYVTNHVTDMCPNTSSVRSTLKPPGIIRSTPDLFLRKKEEGKFFSCCRVIERSSYWQLEHPHFSPCWTQNSLGDFEADPTAGINQQRDGLFWSWAKIILDYKSQTPPASLVTDYASWGTVSFVAEKVKGPGSSSEWVMCPLLTIS